MHNRAIRFSSTSITQQFLNLIDGLATFKVQATMEQKARKLFAKMSPNSRKIIEIVNFMSLLACHRLSVHPGHSVVVVSCRSSLHPAPAAVTVVMDAALTFPSFT